MPAATTLSTRATILSCARRWTTERRAVEHLPFQAKGFSDDFVALRPAIAEELGDQVWGFLEDAYESWALRVYALDDPNSDHREALSVETVFAIIDGPPKAIAGLARDPDAWLASAQTEDRILALLPAIFSSEAFAQIPPDAIFDALSACGDAQVWGAPLPRPGLANRMRMARQIGGIARASRSGPHLFAGIVITYVDPTTLESGDEQEGAGQPEVAEVEHRFIAVETAIARCIPGLTITAYSNPITALRALRNSP